MTDPAGKVKLTGAQRELLGVMAMSGSAHCIQIEPIWSLVRLGLAKRSPAPNRYFITPAGRALLSEGGE